MLPSEEQAGEGDKLSPPELLEAANSLKTVLNKLVDAYVSNNDDATISAYLAAMARSPTHVAVLMKMLGYIMSESVNQKASITITSTKKGLKGAENSVLNLMVRDPTDEYPKVSMELIEEAFNKTLSDYKKSDPLLN